MEKEFAEFLSGELLDFCSYGSREDNLAFSATNRCEELDALTKLTSKEVEESRLTLRFLLFVIHNQKELPFHANATKNWLD